MKRNFQQIRIVAPVLPDADFHRQGEVRTMAFIVRQLTNYPLKLTFCVIALAVKILGAPSAVHAQTGQLNDDDFSASIREWTTRPEFLSPLIIDLPIVDNIPSPKQIIGHHIGKPGRLTYYEDLLRYYRALAESSPRVSIVSIGQTDEHREMVVVAIANVDTLSKLEEYRGHLRQLADPRRLSETSAKKLIKTAKPIYHFMAGLHSAETGPPEMLMELAYRLAVEEGPLFDQIRDNVIVTLTPVADPDGRDRYIDWYYRHLVEITDDREQIAGPPFWGKYVFHDNNRDINFSQVSMRNILQWYLRWTPPVVHDLHESVPFLYTFSGRSPQNPLLDPIVYGELPWFANFEMAQLTKYGMPGVWTHNYVDMWSPGYLAFMASNHNGLVRFYETFGNRGATTMMRHLKTDDNSPEEARTSREWYRPLPPYDEVLWSMRNNTNYSETAALTALQLVSSNPSIIIDNFYRKSLNAIEEGTRTAPHGFIIPSEQRDMTRVETLLNLLLVQGIEVGQSKKALTIGSKDYPTGSYIIKGNQPYFRLAKIFLTHQTYPNDNLRTYDDTGWTMGLMHHTVVSPIDDREILNFPVDLITTLEIPGTVTGSSQPNFGFAVAHYGSNHMTTLRYRIGTASVDATEEQFTIGDTSFPPGSFIIPTPPESDLSQQLVSWVQELGLTATQLTERPEVSTHSVDLPRLAIYSTWGDTQEVGWVRHAFDQFEIPFDLIYKDRVRRGVLRRNYDVILVPNQGNTAKGLVFDIDPRNGPLPYTKTERFRFLGDYGTSADITGGMGIQGVLALQSFIDEGGVLVTLGTSSQMPPEFGLSREIDMRQPTDDFYAPGPVVEAEIKKHEHPIFYGYEQTNVSVRYANGPLLNIPHRFRDDWTIMAFNGEVLSGHMRGEDQIAGMPAIVDIPRGRGRVLLFSTNPCYRWQNHGEFGMLFNTLLHFNDLPQ